MNISQFPMGASPYRISGIPMRTNTIVWPANPSPQWIRKYAFRGQQGICLAPWETSTIFGSDGITPIAGFNKSAGKILDLSGNNNHATQSTSSKQLIYKLDDNSKPYLYGDGLDDVMSFPCLNLVNNIPSITIIAAVAFRSSPATTKVVFSASMPSGYGLRQAITGGTSANYWIFATRQLDADSSIFIGASGVAAGTPTVLTASSDFINRVALFRTNGVQTSSNRALGVGGNTSATDSTLVSIAGRNDAFADINLYGLLVRVPALSASEYMAVENFFKSKCGI